MPAPIGIAILGGGIFIQEAHLPALKDVGSSSFKLVGIYSRSLSSSQASADVAAKLGLGTPAVYHDGDSASDLAALLARKDVHAVIIALPITKQGEIVIDCLKAGKHVLSEKPVGRDVAEGIELIKTYEKVYKPKGLIWRVAENFEVEPTYLYVKEAIAAGKIGKVQTFSLISASYVDPEESKWYKTPWRTVPEYQGGFLLDGGVHSAAFLRTVLPAPVVSLSGYAVLLNEHLAPHDCIHSTLKCADGVQGIFSLNFGASGYAGGGTTLIQGSDGSIDIKNARKDDKSYIVATLKLGRTNAGPQKEEVFESPSCGVQKEQEYFFAAINGTAKDDFGNPRGAVADVAVIQGSLTSNGSIVEFSKLIPKF